MSYLVLLLAPAFDNLMVRLGVNTLLGSPWLFQAGGAYLLSQVWAPVFEEVLKVLPVVLLVLWARSGLRTQSGPLDIALLAAACGAGFGFAEDINKIGSPYWRSRAGDMGYVTLQQLPFSLFPAGYEFLYGILRPVMTLQGGPFSLFPELYINDPVLFLGHGTLPLAFGLALGLAIVAARHYRSRWAYLLPVWILSWNIWEHMMANWWQDPQVSIPLVIGTLDLHGRVLPFVLIAGWITASCVSQRVLRQYRDPETTLSRGELSYANYKSRGWFGPIALAWDWATFLRMHRKVAYGFFHYEQAGEDQRRQMNSLLASRANAYFLSLRLRGQAVPALSPRSRQILNRATPFA